MNFRFDNRDWWVSQLISIFMRACQANSWVSGFLLTHIANVSLLSSGVGTHIVNVSLKKLTMWILAGLLLVSLETLLLDFASGGICQPLNTTLFNSCVQAGYYNSSAFDSGRQGEVASLIFNLQKRFNCSSLTNLMTCPLYLPICQSTKLPCKSTCKKFLSDCRNVSSENDGLKALFRGLCGVLPSTRCTSHSTHSNDSGTDNSGK